MSPALTQPRPPQIHEYDHLGTYLRDLRRYYNLQVNDVAQRIHIRAKYIQAIEDQKPELLPGKVYARGYIATYAEFLGLEPEAFTERYLGQEVKPPAETKIFVPEPKRKHIERKGTKHPPYWLIACVGLLVAAYLLMPAGDMGQSEETADTVEEVPEYLTERLRNGLMPTVENLPCLSSGRIMACITLMAQRTTVAVPQMEVPVQWRHAEDVIRMEEEAAAAAKREENTIPVMTPVVAPEEKPEAPVAPKPAPQAVKPKPEIKPAPRSDVKPAPKPEAKKPEPKPEVMAPVMPPKAEPEANPAESAEPLPWMNPSAGGAQPGAQAAIADEPPPSYRDPNASEDFYPRRRR